MKNKIQKKQLHIWFHPHFLITLHKKHENFMQANEIVLSFSAYIIHILKQFVGDK
jgi:hypothetical protein